MKKRHLLVFAFIICCIYSLSLHAYAIYKIYNRGIYLTLGSSRLLRIENEEIVSIPQKWIIVGIFSNVFILISIVAISYRNAQRKKRINKIIENSSTWIDAYQDGNDIEKENMIAQFEVLKKQMNPHFLFNSLNIISSLIKKDPIKAYSFTKEFSKIYRTILDKKDVMFIKISEELDFASSYIFLQNIRFNENILFNIKIPGENLSLMVPPFSLQILIENAIKHNIISTDNPLKIDIYCDGPILVVQNNLQRRSNQDHTPGTGYTNLVERYKFMTNETPEFYTDGVHYFARLPLLTN